MNTTHRDYSEAAGDFNRLARFFIEHNRYLRLGSTWSLSRLADWKYGLYENKTAIPAFCDRNAHLWFDGYGYLVGVVISENGDTGWDVITLEGYRFLYGQLLQWALDHWGARGPRIYTEITDRQTLEADVLRQAGFALDDSGYTRRYDLTQDRIPSYPLEPGFTIVDMATYPDYRAQRILRNDAFRNRRDVGEEELHRQLRFYNHGHQGPLYHPDTDLCVMAPDGRFVAGCEALIDAHNLEADVQRVCTHSEFRRRGFARVVIAACFTRLRAMGLRSAHITGYSPEAIALYGSMGAVEEVKFDVYTLTAC